MQAPIVQWSFLQYKKLNRKTSAPIAVASQTFTQIGTKLLAYGGCDYNGEPSSQLYLYDTISYEWSVPDNATEFQESNPNARYGHSSTVIEMHPPKIMIFGGMVGGKFEDINIYILNSNFHLYSILMYINMTITYLYINTSIYI